MPIIAEELVERYPTLYHMAFHGSWPSIQQFGLLSSESLVNLFEVPEPRRTELLMSQRINSELITDAVHGSATLRDQKPLSEKNLLRCLQGCTPQQWYRTLNARVFLWLNRDRLFRLMSAKEYDTKIHTVLELDTSGIVSAYADRIELAAMNTGNTLPFPHRRGLSTFRPFTTYPYETRGKLNDYSAVVELTVMGGIPDVQKFVRKVEHARMLGGTYTVEEVLLA